MQLITREKPAEYHANARDIIKCMHDVVEDQTKRQAALYADDSEDENNDSDDSGD